MKHWAVPRFWGSYNRLPQKIRQLADKNYHLLKTDPSHPSLQFKKVGRQKQLWSVRIGRGYRALGMPRPDGVVWFWIGSHAEYDELIGR